MTFFEVVNISKGFGGLMALNKVDFTVNEGEIVGLIGQTAPVRQHSST